MSKFCIDCVHYRIGICDARGIYPYPPDRTSCDKFAPMSTKESCVAKIEEIAKQTVFHSITASPEVLSEEFVEMMYDRVAGDYRYYSMLTGEFYNNRDEAIVATVARLKEVAE